MTVATRSGSAPAPIFPPTFSRLESGMSISQLRQIIAPPACPVESDRGRWVRSQKVIGTKLPKSYLEYALAYGSGRIVAGVSGRIEIYNPLAEHYVSFLQDRLALSRDMREAASGASDWAYKVFPKRPGLFPVGELSNGNYLYYLTRGSPDDWPVVVYRGEGDLFAVHNEPLGDFLTELLLGHRDVPPWTPAWVRKLKRLKFEAEPMSAPEPEPTEKNLYEWYVDNGNRAGFWVRTHAMGDQEYYHIKTVGGKSQGPLAGEPPYFGTVPVVLDAYANGELVAPDVTYTWQAKGAFMSARPPSGRGGGRGRGK